LKSGLKPVLKLFLVQKQKLTKAVTNNMAEVWKSKELSTGLKVRLAIALIWSVTLYACETRTIRKQEEKMIEALEMWIWR